MRIGNANEMCSWDELRRDHGWAAVQFQSILRTDLDVPEIGERTTPIRIELTQGTEYALIPLQSPTLDDKDLEEPVRWYQGDVYDFVSTPSGSRQTTRLSNFARSIALIPGRYKVIVRAMYEIRMFGDPGLGKVPTIDMALRVEVDDHSGTAELVGGLRVIPDMIDGWLMGEWMSVPIRIQEGIEGQVTVKRADAMIEGTDIVIERAEEEIKLQPGQIRPIAFRISQLKATSIEKATLKVKFHLDHRNQPIELIWKHEIVQRSYSHKTPILMTFASPSTPTEDKGPALVSYAMVVPPLEPPTDSERLPPVILGLHGAGVDIESPFWQSALPVYPGMWAVLPTGKNEWGEDWHGGSMADAWAARAALPDVARRLGERASCSTL